MLAVAARAGHRGIASARVGQSDRSRRQNEGRDQSLDVPFPRRRQCLVEVIDVEDDVAFRRCKATEVHQMAVAACLHPDADVGRSGEVGGHHPGGATVEGKRRLEHPAVADRHKVRQPAGIRRTQQIYRIRARLAFLPGGMLGARELVAQRPARRCPLIVREGMSGRAGTIRRLPSRTCPDLGWQFCRGEGCAHCS